MAQLPVHLNRDGDRAVETEPAFEADGSFSLLFVNHGTPAHVHLRLDDTLSRVVTLDAHNHYVEDRATVEIPVVEDRPDEVSGTLEIVTGYGADAAAVTVTLAESPGVVVDESLSTPDRDDDGDRDPRTLAVGSLAAAAVVAAAVLAVVLEGPAVVALGAAAVVVALGAAAYLVRS
ncbi:MAG: hypothetical protein ABEH77_00830 [Halobacteriaceae archaeon]